MVRRQWLPFVKKSWASIRDIGALHTRLVPGFVVDTKLEPGQRVVTFGNGMIVREPIVDIDDKAHRLVWSAIGGSLTHYNASVEVFPNAGGQTRVVWIADLLPNEAARDVGLMMEQGMAVMKKRSIVLSNRRHFELPRTAVVRSSVTHTELVTIRNDKSASHREFAKGTGIRDARSADIADDIRSWYTPKSGITRRAERQIKRLAVD